MKSAATLVTRSRDIKIEIIYNQWISNFYIICIIVLFLRFAFLLLLFLFLFALSSWSSETIISPFALKL